MSLASESRAAATVQRVRQTETITPDFLRDQEIILDPKSPASQPDYHSFLSKIQSIPELEDDEALQPPATASPWLGASDRTPYEWALLLQDAVGCLSDHFPLYTPADDVFSGEEDICLALLMNPSSWEPLDQHHGQWDFLDLYESDESSSSSSCCLISTEEEPQAGIPLRSEVVCLLLMACRKQFGSLKPPTDFTVTTVSLTSTSVRVLSLTVSDDTPSPRVRISTKLDAPLARLAGQGAAWYHVLSWLVGQPDDTLRVSRRRGEREHSDDTATTAKMRYVSERLFSQPAETAGTWADDSMSQASSMSSSPPHP